MNMQSFNQNRKVKIKEDNNLNNTGLVNASGIIVSMDGILVNVMITSGNYLGKTCRFVHNQLDLISE